MGDTSDEWGSEVEVSQGKSSRKHRKSSSDVSSEGGQDRPNVDKRRKNGKL